LPKRPLDFFSADLQNSIDLKRLKKFLHPILHKNHSFILLEGITHYLEMKTLNTLFELFANIQLNDSVIAFDFWDPQTKNSPVYQKYITYCEKRFGHKQNNYNLFDVEFISHIKGYEIIDLQNIQKFERKYLNTTLLQNYNEILPGNYVV